LGKQHHSDQYRGRTDDELAKTPLRKLQPVSANHDFVSQVAFVRGLSSSVELNEDIVAIKLDFVRYLMLLEMPGWSVGESRSNRKKIMLVCEHKTQFKVAREIVLDLEKKDIDVFIQDYDSSITYSYIFYSNLFLYDALVLLIGGPQMVGFVGEMNKVFIRSGKKKRPLFISMVVGAILDVVYHGTYYFRSVCDIVCVPRKIDVDRISKYYCLIGLRNKSVIDVKVPIFNRIFKSSLKVLDGARSPIKTIVFAVQTNIPRSLVERRYVVERLCEYAVEHPDRKVIIKPKIMIDEKGGHPQKFAYEQILKDMGKFPSNLLISYSDVVDLMQESDLVITVSSTAIIEAALLGKYVAIINDFGVLESLGNTYFIESNCLRSFDEIIRDDVDFADRDWLMREVDAPLLSERIDEIFRQYLPKNKLIESPVISVALRMYSNGSRA
jgi:hypothetical protein